MGYELRKARMTIDAEAIAKGLIEMMEEDDPNNVALIRFGMLPAKWMRTVEKMLGEVISERLHCDPKSESDIVVFSEQGEDGRCVAEIRPRAILSEMLHEVSLALYRSVDMVV